MPALTYQQNLVRCGRLNIDNLFSSISRYLSVAGYKSPIRPDYAHRVVLSARW
jgi:hypothetical protein